MIGRMAISRSPNGSDGNEIWGDDWAAARALWRLDPAVAHLNHGSFGAVPAPVLEVQEQWRQRAESNPTGFHERELPRLLDGVRERVASFVGAEPDGLVLLPNVTAAMGAVFASAGLSPRDEVLITDHAYTGVRAAADVACRSAGAVLREVRLGLDILDNCSQVLAAITAGISSRTRLVVIDHITSPTGAVLDVRTLVANLRERDLSVAVDGAHAPGSLDLDVAAVGADHYVGNLHKWCCAPRGAGFIAVAPAQRPALRTALIGARWEEGFPAAMEWWGTADYSALLSAPSALDLLEHLGPARVREHGHRLAAWGQEIVATALDTQAPHLPHAAMTLVALPHGIACTRAEADRLRAVIAERLGAEVMLVPHAGRGYLRLSAHVYNRPREYELLAAGLMSVLGDADAGVSAGGSSRSARLAPP
jgi:isopenicillin-N epimerase